MVRTRRALLVAAAGLLGAGCTAPVDESGPGAPTGTTTSPPAERTPTGSGTSTGTATATPTPPPDVTLAAVRATPTLVRLHTDYLDVYGDADEQFVVATAETGPGVDGPAPDDYALRVDGETVGVLDGLRDGPAFYEAFRLDGGARRWLAFPLPKPLEAERVAVTWPGGELALSDAALARLALPPTSFEVRAFSAPEAVALDEPAPLSVTVANVGDADGTFVAGLNRSGTAIPHQPETVARLAVPAGGTATWEYEVPGEGRREELAGGELTFDLNVRGGSRSRTVGIEEE
jgi:hypothetical protein